MQEAKPQLHTVDLVMVSVHSGETLTKTHTKLHVVSLKVYYCQCGPGSFSCFFVFMSGAYMSFFHSIFCVLLLSSSKGLYMGTLKKMWCLLHHPQKKFIATTLGEMGGMRCNLVEVILQGTALYGVRLQPSNGLKSPL